MMTMEQFKAAHPEVTDIPHAYLAYQQQLGASLWSGDPFSTAAFGHQVTDPSQTMMRSRIKRLEAGELRLRRGKAQPTSGAFGRPSIDNVDVTDPLRRIDLRSSDVRKLGSVPPIVSDGFGITYTDTTATIYWDGTNGSSRITIRRSDGSFLVIPPNSMAITGLTASTTYYLLPYWATESENDGCGHVGWIAGDYGSPQFCMTEISADRLQQQILQGRERLANPYVGFTTGAPAAAAAQTTSGGGSGAAGTSYVDSTGRVRTPSLP